MATLFLSLDEIVAIHAEMIRRYGGSTGIRDLGLLEAAAAMPEASFGGQYLHDGLPAMAAAYLFHLVSNHPFIDGNKRVGAAAADVFLGMHGCHLGASQDEYAAFVLAVAAGQTGKEAAVTFFHRHTRCEEPQ
ncbi:MAG: type II toxin-antitoxin system death-on-curing family toxin [Planctomycetota bacterium]